LELVRNRNALERFAPIARGIVLADDCLSSGWSDLMNDFHLRLSGCGCDTLFKSSIATHVKR
jgi:acyl carrier protein phosphodiesterase